MHSETFLSSSRNKNKSDYSKKPKQQLSMTSKNVTKQINKVQHRRLQYFHKIVSKKNLTSERFCKKEQMPFFAERPRTENYTRMMFWMLFWFSNFGVHIRKLFLFWSPPLVMLCTKI